MKSHKNDVGQLAALLGYSEAELINVIDNASRYYRPFHLVTTKIDKQHKKIKKTRHIDNPPKKLPLRALQVQIKKKLLNTQHTKIDPSLKGGIKKRSMLEHLSPHIGRKTIVCMDLSNCFPSISQRKIFEVWSKQLGYSNEVSKLLTKATVFHGYLPQGAPTSSMLCNFALNPMAKELRELLSKNDIEYTQYIDDICFSGDDIVTRRMIGEVHRITYSFGQRIKKSKTEIMDTKHKQEMMGIVVNAKTKVNEKYVLKIFDRIKDETSKGFIGSNTKLSIAGQILHVTKYDQQAGAKLQKLFDNRITGVYEEIAPNKKDGVIKPCLQYRFARSRYVKCTHLVS